MREYPANILQILSEYPANIQQIAHISSKLWIQCWSTCSLLTHSEEGGFLEPLEVYSLIWFQNNRPKAPTGLINTCDVWPGVPFNSQTFTFHFLLKLGNFLAEKKMFLIDQAFKSTVKQSYHCLPLLNLRNFLFYYLQKEQKIDI